MARRKERRAPRRRVLETEPILVDGIRGTVGDTTVEARSDGISGRLERRPPRLRKSSIEPLPFSDLQMLQALACYGPLWALASTVDATLPTVRRPGRRRVHRSIEILLFECATW